MQLIAGSGIRLSATDLTDFLQCRHRSAQNHAALLDERPQPDWADPDAATLRQLGHAHEAAFLATLPPPVTDLRRHHHPAAATRAALRRGDPFIAQAALEDGPWIGYPDLLVRVPRPSRLGPWSYEAWDCKLARQTKAATILQLTHYSVLLEAVQGVLPDEMAVIPPGFVPERHRVTHYSAIYRAIARQLQAAVAQRPPTAPEPNPHCGVCRYWHECDSAWRRADHLSLTAGVTRLQRKQLAEWDIVTLTGLAGLPVPLPWRPRHGARESYVRIREQARVQLQGRNIKQPVHELLLPLEENRGLARLPAPDPGDLFFDLESDPFTAPAGREYLFGVLTGEGAWHTRWALASAAEEKAAFEWFIDFVDERRRQFPGLHVYHYSPKEPSALKALMGRHATREEALDRFLRAGLFIDLHSITRQALRASVEEYSLKALEPFHGFTRQIPLPEASTARHRLEHALQLGLAVERLPAGTVETVERYNQDDCLSTRSLRDWLELLRAEAGVTTRPPVAEEKPSEKVEQHNERTQRLAALLRDGQEPGSPRWLLSNLLDWHRRENKVAFWEKFRLQELPDDELLYEKDALGELEFVRALEDRDCEYEFPPQETSLHEGDTLYSKDLTVGRIESLHLLTRRLVIRHSKKAVELQPRAVYSITIHNTDEHAGSLARFAQWLCTPLTATDDSPFHAAAALLRRDPPRLLCGTLREPGESALDAARRLALTLDRSVLPIQGPPGTGKTYTGARMILALVRAGRRVGITANSHKVIRNLLDAVAAAAEEAGLEIVCGHKPDHKSEHPPAWLREFTDNAKAHAAFTGGECAVFGGTSWLWSREEFAGVCDTLFIDEAGQMSLANALAVAPAARNVILLGDPQQLDQPSRGSHPEGAAVSALEHLLDGAATIPSDRGLFLAETRRLHPAICRFTSETFYDGRLNALAGLENQRLEGFPRLPANGLVWLPVHHEGNQNRSIEEADVIQSLVGELLGSGVFWINAEGQRAPLSREHLMVVAPYNAQVNELGGRLPGIAVGTVDKFQGQEAPVVFYSLTTSSPQDAPRGMEFLYSHNRLNVATSRAKALAIVVGSPALMAPECQTPRQLALANGLSSYVECCTMIETEQVVRMLSR